MILKNIRFNNSTQWYEVVEAGIKYEFDDNLLNDLNKYYKKNPELLIAHWYRSLDDSDKEKVNRSSAFN